MPRSQNSAFQMRSEALNVSKRPQRCFLHVPDILETFERKNFQVILTPKIDFFDVEKFLNFTDLRPKTVTPRGSEACKTFFTGLTPMMWVFEIFPNIRAFQRM